MLSCKQTSQLLSQSLDRKLSLRERIGVRLHLLICDVCARFVMQLEMMRHYLRHMRDEAEQDESVQISAEAKARIAESLESKLYNHAYNDEQHKH